LKQQGQLQVRDLADGTVVLDAKTQPLKQRFEDLSFHETPTGFVLLTRSFTNQFRVGTNRLSSFPRAQQRVNGYACGVDLRQPRIVWESPIATNYLPVPQPRNLPVILLASVHNRSEDNNVLKTLRYELTAIDTRTGKPVTQFTTDKPFRAADALSVKADGQPDARVEIRITGSESPVTISLDYKETP
jgi:hypothetical protein